MTEAPAGGTFAAAAAAGIYWSVVCQACRRATTLTARRMVEAGHGARASFAFHAALTCTGCGTRGRVWLQVLGYWTGVPAFCPPDWAETVDRRAAGERG